jgi:hypothetical protein
MRIDSLRERSRFNEKLGDPEKKGWEPRYHDPYLSPLDLSCAQLSKKIQTK